LDHHLLGSGSELGILGKNFLELRVELTVEDLEFLQFFIFFSESLLHELILRIL
jgi:hypothetical protein